MSEQKFLKTPCEHCGENIEFPADGLGMAVPCPHCQKRTRLNLPGSSAAFASVPSPTIVPASAPSSALPVPSRSPTPPPAAPAPPSSASANEEPGASKSKTGLLVGVALGILICAAGGYFGYKKVLSQPEGETAIASPKSTKSKKPGATNTEPAGSETSVAPATIKKAKSLQDLKAGAVTLEKSKGGSSLVYGVGDIRNDSDYQRFGVKVELNVFDAAGKNAGKATDYIQVIEPHGSWRFHALILDPKATSAKIASVTEAE
jgi:hypothetical protein